MPALKSLWFVSVTILSLVGCPARLPTSFEYEDRVLLRCDEQWFVEVLSSEAFRDYLNDRIDPAAIDPVEYSKLALAEAFTPRGDLGRVYDVVLRHSNPYAGAALFACLEGYMGNPSSAHYSFREFTEKHAPGSAPELDAAFFAHIRDEESFRRTKFYELTFPVAIGDYPEINMFGAFAQNMSWRNRAYMYHEWKRLSQFENNPQAKTVADWALVLLPPYKQAEQFSTLGRDMRELHRRYGAKLFHVFTEGYELLPPPCEHLILQMGPMELPRAPLSVSDRDGNTVIARDTVKEGEALRLPTVEGREYVLQIDHLGHLPAQSDVVNFHVMPLSLWESWRRHVRPPEATTADPRQPDPRLYDPDFLRQFEGGYGGWVGGVQLRISVEGNVLKAKPLYGPSFLLVPYDGQSFSLGGTSAGTLTFRKGPSGRLAAYIVGEFGPRTLERTGR